MVIGIATILALAGCTTHPKEVSRAAQFSVLNLEKQAGLSKTDSERVSKMCPFGMPKVNPRWNLGPTDLVARDGYVLLHSAVDKIPVWVCEYVTAEQVSGNEGRDDKFQADPLLKTGRRAELKDYVKTGYDRGHQAPAADQTRDARLKAETFFLSNMAPQTPGLNRKSWKALEELGRKWVKDRGSIFIITGGMFYDPKEEDDKSANGVIKHKVIGPNSVAVPTHFYKIFIGKDQSGKWQSIAFVMENREYKAPYHFENCIKSIEWIEKRTGLDFMPDLDLVEQKQLEKSAAVMWN